MSLPRPQAGVVIHAGNVYLHPAAPAELVSLDEHAEDVRQVLVDDQEIDKISQELRRQLIEDLSDAEYFRAELRKMLDLSDEAAAQYGDADLVASVGLRLQRGALDWETVNGVTAVVENFSEDWSAEDLARAVRSALHPLSSSESVVTGSMPAIKPGFSVVETSVTEARVGDTTDTVEVAPSPRPRAQQSQQPAMMQLPARDDPFKP